MGFEQLAALKKQLAAAAKAEKTEKAPKTAKAAKPKSPAKPRKETAPVDPVVLTIGKLQRLFPKTFPKNPAPKLPLKIGIHKELVERTQEIGIDAEALTEAIKTWCRGNRYWACVVEDAPRIDLDGNPAGVVTKQEAGQARALEARRRKGREARETAKEEGTQEQKPATDAETPAPNKDADAETDKTDQK